MYIRLPKYTIEFDVQIGTSISTTIDSCFDVKNVGSLPLKYLSRHEGEVVHIVYSLLFLGE